VLLGGEPGHRLEQVGIVRGTVFECPVLHGRGNRIRNAGIERNTLLDGLLKSLEHRLRQPGLLHLLAEHQRPEQILDVSGAEIDLVQVVFSVRNRIDCFLTGGGHSRRLL